MLAPLEAEAVGIVLEGAALRLAAGAGERALAALLVLLEFNWFSPEGECSGERCWIACCFACWTGRFAQCTGSNTCSTRSSYPSPTPLLPSLSFISPHSPGNRPPLAPLHAGWPEEALEAMFEEFWRSGAPLAGFPGAAGWAAWMAGEPAASAASAAAGSDRQKKRQQREAEKKAEAQAKQAAEAAAAKEAAAAGGSGGEAAWSGWDELAPAIRARFGHALRLEGDGDKEAEREGQEEQQPGSEAGEAEEGEAEGEAAKLSEEEEEEEAAAAAEEEAQQQEETDEQLLERWVGVGRWLPLLHEPLQTACCPSKLKLNSPTGLAIAAAAAACAGWA